MTPERWREVSELFRAALEKDRAERARFVAAACGDDDSLRREVESLLALDQDAGHSPSLHPGLPAPAPDDASTQSMQPPRLGRYEVLSPLGKGGMGQVYLARDTELGRKAALKFLLPEFTRDPEQVRRFRTEAQAASALNHPNIITIYEIAPAGESYFIATEFVDGSTLQQRLNGGPMSAPDTLETAIQVAGALAAVHETGILHRDIKPANIMLRRDGYVKVVDFGLAKLIERGPDGGDSGMKTQPGGVLGTPRYMSPEQVLAQDLDGRSDIFSLGVVLYECLAGRGPFDDAGAEGLGAVMRPEAPLRTHAPGAPPELERIVDKCLAKNPAERYQSARELLAELKNLRLDLELQSRERPAAGFSGADQRRPPVFRRRALLAAGIGAVSLALAAAWARLLRTGGKGLSPMRHHPSIAVLPFADMSSGKNEEYFADGLADELLNRLAAVPGLRVSGRTSSFQFKGKTEDLRAIGRKLNVAAILEGSVRRQDGKARITVRLIDAADGFQIWSSSFDREIKDILAVEEEIARAVARSLEVALMRGKAPVAPTRATHPEAYNACLQGRYFLQRDKEMLEKAVASFDQAIRLDPGYAAAWLGMGEARISQAESGYLPVDSGFRDARRAIERALELDPDLAQAHVARGNIRMGHEWDWAGAEESFHRATVKAPDHPRVARAAGSLAAILGRWDEAIALYRKAVELDPLHSTTYYNLGVFLHYAGRQAEAKAALAKALEIAPKAAARRWMLGRVHLAQSQPEEALAQMLEERNPTFRLHGLALANHALGRSRESDSNLAELTAKFQRDAPYQIAQVYSFRGDAGRAFQWLRRAYTARDIGLTEIKGDPLLEPIKGDPRYMALLRDLRLPL